jgi:hypothetical protein
VPKFSPYIIDIREATFNIIETIISKGICLDYKSACLKYFNIVRKKHQNCGFKAQSAIQFYNQFMNYRYKRIKNIKTDKHTNNVTPINLNVYDNNL